jgi:hypothetical protein
MTNLDELARDLELPLDDHPRDPAVLAAIQKAWPKAMAAMFGG